MDASSGGGGGTAVRILDSRRSGGCSRWTGSGFDVAVGYLNADLKAGLREIDRLCREKLPNAESEWFRPPN